MTIEKEDEAWPQISKNRLKADLRKAGIMKGDCLAVALSLKSMGFVVGGANAFIDALLEVVGPSGTVMMNTHTKFFPLSEIHPDYVFDPGLTVPETGLVPTTLLKREGAVRSRHPIVSVAAIGKSAQYLIKDHDEHSNPYLPLERLAEIGGKLLCIGLDDRLVALRHEAQRRAGLFMVPLFTGVRYRKLNGDIGLFIRVRPPCVSRLPELVPRLERMGYIERCRIGVASSLVGSAGKLLDSMTAILKEDPSLNLCKDVYCVYCRELERRWRLLENIANPELFQKNFLLRRMLGLRSNFFLKRYGNVSFISSRPTILDRAIARWEAVFCAMIVLFVKILSGKKRLIFRRVRFR